MATTTAKLKSADGEAEADPAGGKKKSKKKLIMIVVVVLLLAGGGYFMFGKKKSGPPPAPKPGAVVVIPAITVNLAGGHFLKLGLALQATAKVKTPPDGSQALDIAITELSYKSVAELSSNKARDAIKTTLRKKVIKAYADEVMDVYFTEFVMQ
jgi:flagellar FliL protein